MSSRRSRYGNPCEEQIANAPDDLFPLTPVSEAPAALVRARWLAVLPNQTVPLIWEITHHD